MESTSRLTNEALFDLADPANAYVFGFLQADGTHAAGPGRKGRVSVEIKADDVQLLRDMQQVLPWRSSFTFRPCTANFSSTGTVRTTRPNARDGVMNIMIATDSAVDFTRWRYED